MDAIYKLFCEAIRGNSVPCLKRSLVHFLCALTGFNNFLGLFSQGVASRDIKLENTLLDSSPRPLVKICDFGYSKHEKFQSAPGSRVGTPAYLAPEVIMTKQGSTYDGKVQSCLLWTIEWGARCPFLNLFHSEKSHQ